MNNDRLPRSWTAICPLNDIVPNTGVCALVNGEQVAVFHVNSHDADPAVYAIENFDPGSQAAVLSRGLIGSLGERIVVASPIYKHHFDLRTGECLESPSYSVGSFATRVENGHVWVAV
ncbi:nitrite reductase, NAD(P)H-binding, small subunit [Paraburkholderia ribeironis]|uniref:Nitrite reductase, NAD(P)H-binding, small subunit n=1 Tax=Paraburkholderia ribeironis TaxID=1247936 RepID=A0A1N7RWB7_9BURK|nr:nitrite reductase small subunit NirD [Paraburkholderia ribeironis]SIT39363.1 nitrite reductase, NAD(P)H-binding, small subunit [Paraburkholderia ribeironis]